MMQLLRPGAAALVGAVLFACAPAASANQWNERTTLTFSEPVMVPGATLQPGTYEFSLADARSARHLVQIRKEGGDVVTTSQTVPVKRSDVKGDVVLKFSPTDTGTPPALKSWFYPGSTYGHEFVYSDDEARQIAARSKTVVLSTDVPGTDLEKGVLRTYDPSGKRADWKGDEATMREWDQWQRSRQSQATVRQGATTGEREQATASMVRGDFQGTRVELDELEENTQKYIGKTISVDGEVEEVFGPRLFTIDEANWGDLDGEILVFMPTTLAALVRDDDRITVTGTLKPFVRAEVEREWGWLGLDPEIEIEFSRKPVLIANRIVGGNNNMAMVIEVGKAERPVGTSGSATATSSPLTALATIAEGDEDLVGRSVSLNGAQVGATAQGGGFFLRGTEGSVFVLPAGADKMSVRDGDSVSIQGVIMQMPRAMEDRLKAPDNANDDIYIYATSITK